MIDDDWFHCPDCDFSHWDKEKFREHYEDNHKTPRKN